MNLINDDRSKISEESGLFNPSRYQHGFERLWRGEEDIRGI